MPALDRIHLPIVRALTYAGWLVATKPPTIRIGKRDLIPDLVAQHPDDRHIIVEIKEFAEDQSAVRQLSDALGQYLLYRAALANRHSLLPIYLATSVAAYTGIWSEKLGKMARQRFRIKMIIVDLEREEILEWLD